MSPELSQSMKNYFRQISIVVLGVLIGGCATTYEVYDKPITDDYYRWFKNNRVIAAFERTEKNKENIQKLLGSIQGRYNSSKNTFKKRIESFSYEEVNEKCSNPLILGQFGYYKNAYEKQQLMGICIDKYDNQKVPIYSGSENSAKLSKSDKECGALYIQFKLGSGRKIYTDSAWLHCMPAKQGTFALYIQGHPSRDDFVDDFIFLNNLILNSFEKHELEPLTLKEIQM